MTIGEKIDIVEGMALVIAVITAICVFIGHSISSTHPVYTDGDLEYTNICNVSFQVDRSIIGENTIFINYTKEDDPVLKKKDIKDYQIGIGDSNQVGSRMLIKTTGDKVEDCGMRDKIYMLDKQTYNKLVEAQNK